MFKVIDFAFFFSLLNVLSLLQTVLFDHCTVLFLTVATAQSLGVKDSSFRLNTIEFYNKRFMRISYYLNLSTEEDYTAPTPENSPTQFTVPINFKQQ